MKRCPTCNRTYNDAALAFCPDDGTPLVGVAPAYQQSAPQPQPYQAPGQQYYQQPAPQMSFGQQAARRSKGFAVAAFLFGLVSFALLLVATIRMRGHDWWFFRYNARMPTDVIFWGLSTVGFVILLLAILLGLIALIQSFRNPARYGGKALAFTGPFLGVLAALLTIGLFSYARMKAPSQNYSYDTYSSNSNTYSSNSNTYSANTNTSSSNSNTYSPKSSSTTMSEDDKYRLFYAAAKTGDQKLMMQVSQKIGIVDQNGMPSPSYRDFIKNSITWAFKDSEFTQTINTPEKARAYVMSHL